MTFCRRHVHSLLRRRIRGYTRTRRSLGFDAIRNLLNGLIDVRVISTSHPARWFFGACANNTELVVRQFVFDRYGGTRLNHAIFEYIGSNKPITMAMPASWRIYLASNKWSVNNFISAINWQVVVTLRFFHGLIEIGRLCATQILRSAPALPSGRYVYMHGLTRSNLPPNSESTINFDICNCYSQWPVNITPVQAIMHDVKGEPTRMIPDFLVSYAPPPYKFPMKWWALHGYLIWSVAAALWAGFNLLLGRWHWGLMLGEAARARVVRQIPSNILAAEYLFHASRTIYRPMWTYEAEDKGSQLGIYFYSTTAQPSLSRGSVSQRYEWGPNTWPKYIVWDSYQEARIRRDLGDSVTVIKVGPIYFSDSEGLLPALPSPSVAVFDLQPHRVSSHVGFSTLADCLAAHPDFFHRFLLDVTEVLLASGAKIGLKTKRVISSRGDRSYGHILKALSENSDVCQFDPAISSIKLVMACDASISAPFTSTALYAQELGRPSIYYDPYGWVQRDDEAAHGIPVVFGKEELSEWVNEVVASRVGLTPIDINL